MQKFHRNYKAVFHIAYLQKDNTYKYEKRIEVQNPITCNFQMELKNSSSPAVATFQFINLAPQIQAQLWRDIWETYKGKYIFVEFYAGYGYPDKEEEFIQPLICKGLMLECTSQKPEGSTEWVTNMQVMLNGSIYKYGFVNATFVEGTTLEDVVNYMVSKSPNIEIGYITPDIPPLPRNRTFIGQVMDLLSKDFGDYEIFTDKGLLNILGADDVIPGEVLVITEQSGLLGTPRRASQLVEIDLLFEPRVRIGQAITLLSAVLPRFNGTYKVISIKHNGTISARVAGKLVTTIRLSHTPDAAKLNKLEKAKPTKYEGDVQTKWIKPLKNGKITSNFGSRIDPITNEKKFHNGIDYGAAEGDPIYAPADGIVTFVNIEGGYGRCVHLDNGLNENGQQITSLYGHMSRWNVKQGQRVYKGQDVLGYVGSTGKSTGPHLHFEIREDGRPINPAKYIGN